MDLISFKRQLKLQLYDGSTPNWKPNFPWWFNFSKDRNKINNLKKVGAVLTGSRALQGYQWNGKNVIQRKSKDWDFILTREQLWNFFKLEKISDLDLDSNFYKIDNSVFTFYDGYSDCPDDNTYFGGSKIDLIIQDEIKFIEYNGWKVSDFTSIWENKCLLIEELQEDKSSYMKMSSHKHQNDINFLKLNFLL